MKTTMLNGPLGCAECDQKKMMAIYFNGLKGTTYNQRVQGLGDVKNYDVITIGGNQYSVNSIIGKSVVAKRDTKLYKGSNTKTSTVYGTVKAGQVIGVVYSYLRPDQSSDGNTWLMFDGGATKGFYFAPNEALSETELQNQGTKTVEQELKEEAEKRERENSPVEYYLKKYGLPVLLIVGAIIIAKPVLTEAVKARKQAA